MIWMQWSKMQSWGQGQGETGEGREALSEGQVKWPPLPHAGPHLGWGSNFTKKLLDGLPWEKSDTSGMRVCFLPLLLDFWLTQAPDHFVKHLVLVQNQRENTQQENGSRRLAPYQAVQYLVVHKGPVLIFLF